MMMSEIDSVSFYSSTAVDGCHTLRCISKYSVLNIITKVASLNLEWWCHPHLFDEDNFLQKTEVKRRKKCICLVDKRVLDV